MHFDRDGHVVGPDPALFDDLQQLLTLAHRHAVHVLGVPTSLDHLKPGHPTFRAWHDVFNRDDRLEEYARRFVEPLSRRFADDPALIAREICNEPEWIWVRRCGVPRERVVAFHARVAAALHRAGPVLVTTGSASWAWHRDRGGLVGTTMHPWSDTSLQHCRPEPGARLDFFQVHC